VEITQGNHISHSFVIYNNTLYMGAAGSIDAIKREDILAKAKMFYANSPSDFEDLYLQVKKEGVVAASDGIASHVKKNAVFSASEDKTVESVERNKQTAIESETSAAVAAAAHDYVEAKGGFSKEIADEMTILRLDPPAYAIYLQDHLDNDYDDELVYKKPDENLRVKTIEGKVAVLEAINALKATAPLSAGFFPSGILPRHLPIHHNFSGHFSGLFSGHLPVIIQLFLPLSFSALPLIISATRARIISSVTLGVTGVAHNSELKDTQPGQDAVGKTLIMGTLVPAIL
jgi:hypothetical protein